MHYWIFAIIRLGIHKKNQRFSTMSIVYDNGQMVESNLSRLIQ